MLKNNIEMDVKTPPLTRFLKLLLTFSPKSTIILIVL